MNFFKKIFKANQSTPSTPLSIGGFGEGFDFTGILSEPTLVRCLTLVSNQVSADILEFVDGEGETLIEPSEKLILSYANGTFEDFLKTITKDMLIHGYCLIGWEDNQLYAIPPTLRTQKLGVNTYAVQGWEGEAYAIHLNPPPRSTNMGTDLVPQSNINPISITLQALLADQKNTHVVLKKAGYTGLLATSTEHPTGDQTENIQTYVNASPPPNQYFRGVTVAKLPKDDTLTPAQVARGEVIKYFGIPIQIFGEAPTYENLDAAYQNFFENVVKPLQLLIKRALADALAYFATPFSGLQLAWNREGNPVLDRVEKEMEQRKLNQLVQQANAGLITRNEAREQLGLPPSTTPNMDEETINTTLVKDLNLDDTGFDQPTDALVDVDEDG